MNIKKIHFILVFLMFCSLSISGTYAASSYDAAGSSVTVENHLATGDINIRLDEFQLDENLQEKPYNPPKILLPGDIISKIPRVTNLAEPCYVRAKLSFPSTIADVIPPVVDSDTENKQKPSEPSEPAYILSEKDLLGLSEDWVKIQDYYYYRPILETEESSVLFEGVRIPEYWDNTYTGADFFVNIQIEAVQAAHFTPDYTSDTPWGNIEAEKCIHNEPYKNTTVGFRNLSVEYEGSSKTLLATPEDFFSNFAAAMPGDILTDTVVLENTTSQTAEFFFRTGVPETISSEQLALLDEIVLFISVDGKTLYHGKLLAKSLESDISLGTYESGASREFIFTLEVPAYWTNSYSLRDCAVEWTFSVMPEPVPQMPLSTSPVPQTGDLQMPGVYLLIVIGSVGCITVLWYIRKVKRRDLS